MGNRITNTQRFRASAGNEPAVQQFVSGILQQSSMPLKFRNDVRLAVEELFCNIASYAYGAEGGVVDVTVSIDDDIRFATVILADDGRAFDPFAYERKRAVGDLTLVNVGGLGILLVKRLMDECSYHRVHERNEVTITKRWDTANKGTEALAEAARVIRETEGLEYNAPERSQKPLTDDDLTLVVGGLTMPELPFLRPLAQSALA